MTEKKIPFKIALTGASCTGKTTLLESCKNLYKDNPSIAFVEESARKFFKTFNGPDRFSSETQAQIQNFTRLNEKNAEEKKPTIILTDSSTIDQVVYTKALGTAEGAEKLYENILDWVPSYGKFLMMDPNGVVFENDNIRTESFQERQKVHDAFIELFHAKNIPYEIISGTPDERVKKVDQIIASYSAEK